MTKTTPFWILINYSLMRVRQSCAYVFLVIIYSEAPVALLPFFYAFNMHYLRRTVCTCVSTLTLILSSQLNCHTSMSNNPNSSQTLDKKIKVIIIIIIMINFSLIQNLFFLWPMTQIWCMFFYVFVSHMQLCIVYVVWYLGLF